MEVITEVLSSKKEATMTSDEGQAELRAKMWVERNTREEKEKKEKKKQREAAIEKLGKKLDTSFKVKGVTYITTENCYIPSAPPYTTWSGLMITKPDSPFAERLKNKCGGIAINKAEEVYEGDWRSAENIAGYWTAPEDWPEMSAGREDPTPCSTPDYPKQSFQLSWK
jgi:hypothetical protein